MPQNYDYQEPRRLLSQQRLTSYESSLKTQNDAELFGAYCWNLAVTGAFYPLAQLVEVALRNALHNVALIHYPCASDQYWYEQMPHTSTINAEGRSVISPHAKKFIEKMKSAHKEAKQAISDKTGIAKEPSIDQVIANTSFVAWEYLLDGSFYNGSDRRFLWPHQLTKAFKKLPRVTGVSNVQYKQRDVIRRRIEEIRHFRNRLSHNEPAWRVESLKSKNEVITHLLDKLEKMLELLFWISPVFKRYISDIGIEGRIRQLLTLNELNRYMHIYENHSIHDLESLFALMERANSENCRYYFDINNLKGILSPCNTRLLP